MQILHSRLATVTWPPTRAIGGVRTGRLADIQNLEFSFSFGHLDAAKENHESEMRRRGESISSNRDKNSSANSPIYPSGNVKNGSVGRKKFHPGQWACQSSLLVNQMSVICPVKPQTYSHNILFPRVIRCYKSVSTQHRTDPKFRLCAWRLH